MHYMPLAPPVLHAVKTHRELFADFYLSLFGTPLEDLIAEGAKPEAAEKLWAQMSRDIMTGGGQHTDALEQVSACQLPGASSIVWGGWCPSLAANNYIIGRWHWRNSLHPAAQQFTSEQQKQAATTLPVSSTVLTDREKLVLEQVVVTSTAGLAAMPAASCPRLLQASYALGYNLAIEYLADYEKTWMLDSFRDLNSRIFSKAGR